MKIRNKLTLLFTGIVAAIFLFFAIVIYISFSKNREEEYYKQLKNIAITKAKLLLDAEVSPEVLQLIYRNSQNVLYEEEVAIYDTAFHLKYHDAVNIDKVKETRPMIDEIVKKHYIEFYQGKIQVVGMYYQHKSGNYVLTAAANDHLGYAKLQDLKYTLIIAFLSTIVLIYLCGLFLANKALQPVSELINEVEEITATNLDLRIKEGNGKDEIAELAITFNAMLNRLEKSFDAQKEVVSNLSHELRTPLTAMLAELQLTLEKERTTTAYQTSIAHAISDAQKLVRLSNSLLDLAKASYDLTEIAFRNLRIDELILDARADVLHVQPAYKINIVFEAEIEDDDLISVKGNEYLLKQSFINLIENGCKFSAAQEITIAINHFKDKIILRFQDQGIGIDEKDLSRIFTAFYRGANYGFAPGNGIGLSLTKKILELHLGTISLQSKSGEGSTFTIELPHI